MASDWKGKSKSAQSFRPCRSANGADFATIDMISFRSSSGLASSCRILNCMFARGLAMTYRNQRLKTIIIPADPLPVWRPFPENYSETVPNFLSTESVLRQPPTNRGRR